MTPQLVIGLITGALALTATFVLLQLQINTYRATKHSSTSILIVSSVLAILFSLASYLPFLSPAPFYASMTYQVMISALVISQAALAVWGSARLFRAFRDLRSRTAEPTDEASASGAAPPVAKSGHPATTADGRPGSRSRARSLVRPLIDVARLWALVPRADLANRSPEILSTLLAAGSVAMWVALDRIRSGPGSIFTSWNVPTLALYLLLALGVAFIAARATVPRLPMRATNFMVAAVMPIVVLLGWLVDMLPARRGGAVVTTLLTLYLLLYGIRALRRVTGGSQWVATALLIPMIIGFVVLTHYELWQPSLWYVAPDDASESDSLHGDAASVLFNQRDQIDQSVRAMSIDPKDSPQVFFLGFAGVGSQRVFAEEIKFAAQVVGKRFDSSNRQILLVNDRRDPNTYPVATTTSLAYALSAMAERMNKDRDILFLSLSSHGGPDPVLSVSNDLFMLDNLTGDALGKALEKSGIRNRVIVISACHAGAFIPGIRNENTIVITAAAAANTSFGCSDDRDLTYFGEAFYRDSLPSATSLPNAFDQAKALIAARESSEKEKPSDPQAYFGENLVRILDRLKPSTSVLATQ